jgi:hypothetical protein
MPQWQNDYLRGTGMEMYTECLSEAFNGMTFPEAAEYVLLFSFENDLHWIYTFPTFQLPIVKRF